ncbi:hypothetical protein L7F22_019257 [Adiantum nelumboides]|nr:hypothetical protein [Adiantum nelumboides]
MTVRRGASAIIAAHQNALRANVRNASVQKAMRPNSISNLASSRQLTTSSVRCKEEGKSKQSQGLFSSLLHGSETAKQDGLTAQSHSTTVGRGKYIHEIQRHVVRPDKVDEYKSILSQHYPRLSSDDSVNGRLIGSFEVQIGEMETFYHIWEYDGYAGYDQSSEAFYKSKENKDLVSQLRSTLASRSNWVTQEFAFWATVKAQKSNVERPLYELRTYHLKPGMLLEWETNWRRGLEARKRFVQPIAAYFSQIGQLHTVQHIWRYDSLEQRKATRDAAWQVETWNDTVTQTVKLIDKMHAQIMVPLPWSPLH